MWAPPPAAAHAALDELGTARHKRPSSSHIVIVPRLFTAQWRRMLGKMVDLLFFVPCGHSIWGKDQHEPLTIALCLPLISHRPWSLRGCPAMLAAQRQLRGLLAGSERDERNYLRKLLNWTRSLGSLPEDVVWKMLHHPPEESFSN